MQTPEAVRARTVPSHCSVAEGSFFFQNTMAKPVLQKPVTPVVKEPAVPVAREEDRKGSPKGSPYGQWVPVKKEEKKTFLNFSPKSAPFRAR